MAKTLKSHAPSHAREEFCDHLWAYIQGIEDEAELLNALGPVSNSVDQMPGDVVRDIEDLTGVEVDGTYASGVEAVAVLLKRPDEKGPVIQNQSCEPKLARAPGTLLTSPQPPFSPVILKALRSVSRVSLQRQVAA